VYPDQHFADLLRRARQGSEQAAADLIRAYEPERRRFIRFRLTDPDLHRFLDSPDVCQSVLASFFVPAGRARTWRAGRTRKGKWCGGWRS
jgi:hypothetical protein